jgi:hypothetical protein
MGRSALGIIKKYYPQVNKVVDAKRPATFQVVAADCKSSRRKSPDNCALARACQRIYDGAIISMSTAYLINGTKALRYEVPVRISRELVSFDRHHDFSLGVYTLKNPTNGFKLGTDKRKRERDDEPRRPGQGRPIRHHKTEGVRSL